MYKVEPVSFVSHGDRVCGQLFLPDHGTRPAATYITIGPVGSVKEQSPLQYATRLARAGAVALTFDPRGFGASEGEPRQFDDPARKVEDLRAAADFVTTRVDLESSELTVLGICMGCNWAAQAAADDDRFQRSVFVAGAYSIRDRRIESAGSESAYRSQLAEYRVARQRFENDGTLEYHTMVAERMEDSYFSWPVPYHWYRMWTDPGPLTYKGAWENRLATISDAGHYAFDVIEAFRRIAIPALIINSNASATPLDAVQSLIDELPSTNSRLVNTGDHIQTQFYDDPVTIDLAVEAILDWHAV